MRAIVGEPAPLLVRLPRDQYDNALRWLGQYWEGEALSDPVHIGRRFVLASRGHEFGTDGRCSICLKPSMGDWRVGDDKLCLGERLRVVSSALRAARELMRP